MKTFTCPSKKTNSTKTTDSTEWERDGPALVEIDDKDDVVTEARQAVRRRHRDDERKHVVDERVERLSERSTERA